MDSPQVLLSCTTNGQATPAEPQPGLHRHLQGFQFRAFFQVSTQSFSVSCPPSPHSFNCPRFMPAPSPAIFSTCATEYYSSWDNHVRQLDWVLIHIASPQPSTISFIRFLPVPNILSISCCINANCPTGFCPDFLPHLLNLGMNDPLASLQQCCSARGQCHWGRLHLHCPMYCRAFSISNSYLGNAWSLQHADILQRWDCPTTLRTIIL